MTEFNYSERWPMHPQFQRIRVLNSLVGKCLEDGVGVGIQFCMCVCLSGLRGQMERSEVEGFFSVTFCRTEHTNGSGALILIAHFPLQLKKKQQNF